MATKQNKTEQDTVLLLTVLVANTQTLNLLGLSGEKEAFGRRRKKSHELDTILKDFCYYYLI